MMGFPYLIGNMVDTPVHTSTGWNQVSSQSAPTRISFSHPHLLLLLLLLLLLPLLLLHSPLSALSPAAWKWRNRATVMPS